MANDTERSYAANSERQLAIERLLIRFGEALKDIPNETLRQIDPDANWAGPKGFRDIASHWYQEGLDHTLIWRAVKLQMPTLVASLKRWLDQHPDLLSQ